MYSRYFCQFLILSSSMFVEASERFSGVDLWLPKALQNHYVLFLNSAEKAQAEPHCHKLLSGRLIERPPTKQQSTKQQSIMEPLQFRFRCRTEDKKTFSIQVDASIVDGSALVVANQYIEHQKKIEAAKKEAEARLQAKAALYWDVCFSAIQERLKQFDEPEMLSSPIPPQPIVQDKQLIYLVDFNSRSQSKKVLRFVVRCEISSLDMYRVRVLRRKKRG